MITQKTRKHLMAAQKHLGLALKTNRLKSYQLLPLRQIAQSLNKFIEGEPEATT